MTTVVVCCALIGGIVAVSSSIIDCDVFVSFSVVVGGTVVTSSKGVVCITVPIIHNTIGR